MYQSFTGSARRPRQVNLSGRPSNPFTTTSGAQNAIASAQQDRVYRQQQRDRSHASIKIQAVWRGHAARRRTFKIWRQIWDAQEERANGAYTTSEESLGQLHRLMLFFSPQSETSDIERLRWYGTRQITTSESVSCTGDAWLVGYAKLRDACIQTLMVRANPDAAADRDLLGILAFAACQSLFQNSDEATKYYSVLTTTRDLPIQSLQGAFLAPLKQSAVAHSGLVVLLTRPLEKNMLDLLRNAIDQEALSKAIASLQDLETHSPRERLWLLGNVIFICEKTGRSMEYMMVISRLLGSLADHVLFEGAAIRSDNLEYDEKILSKLPSGFLLNEFLRDQISSLIDKDTIRNLAIQDNTTGNRNAHILASYALTLLRCYPKRADEIRMWLYRGPVQNTGTPATQTIWEASKTTWVFKEILSSSRTVLPILKSPDISNARKDDWTIILVFLELYTFVVKIMDDEEFMGNSQLGRQNNAISIADVAILVTFLKNLVFTLFYNIAEINDRSDTQMRSENSLTYGRYSAAPSSSATAVETRSVVIADIPGLTIDYLKGLTSGLLRAIYERDSRRTFLPKDHWLMTDRFDMGNFIPGVVSEEEARHGLQEEMEENDPDDSEEDFTPISGGGRARVLRSQEQRTRAARKMSRQRYMESVAPRLEILQNMPFFIPFHTRVEIFRQFVELDQYRRRNGEIDPDLWRQNIALMQAANGQNPRELLSRHHATIKRTQEFMDAYGAFYELGPGLKEPIQITFVDSFGMPEAGIDGGGVTKEFLTSVIAQAFHGDSDLQHKFFVENEKHVLHPNPTSIEDLRVKDELLGRDAPTLRNDIREMLKQYEFLGRIIGKCLYEGILVDVSFAGFFLKKWALTGGSGSASKESGYYANINDLRDLDEDLYRGLLKVKNAEDAEAFQLTFALDDLVGPEGNQRVIEHELVPGGSATAVTNENRLFYISRLSKYRLQEQSAPQTSAFLKGLGSMVQPSWLSMFNQSELQTLIGGAASGIDVQDLRRNTMYGGTYVIGDDGLEHPSVQMFWSVMFKMPDEDRQKVLKFVTSTPRGPLLGFSHLNPKFSIRDSGSDENRFPTTSTCVNLLKLPMYKSEQALREKLLAAVNSGAGFDLS